MESQMYEYFKSLANLGFTLFLQDNQRIHNFMKRPRIEVIAYMKIYILL